eukprot:c20303_g3_i1.p1 GENE.c20303_g3_i1~~c20303_g3_i1.p1  ORF type:complete len:218 (-),score=56.03 c20303_g3_i1:77-730(-)
MLIGRVCSIQTPLRNFLNQVPSKTNNSLALIFSSNFHTSSILNHFTRDDENCVPKIKKHATETTYIDGTPRRPISTSLNYRFGLQENEIENENLTLKHIFSTKMATKPEILKLKIQQTIERFQRVPNETGSSEVQIAVLTVKIENLTEHLRHNKHDTHCLRGLHLLVGRRRKLMKYLRRTNMDAYKNVCQRLQLKDIGEESLARFSTRYTNYPNQNK